LLSATDWAETVTFEPATIEQLVNDDRNLVRGHSTRASGRAKVTTGEFELEVSPLMPDLLRYFTRRVRPVDDAYDCLSETLTVLWRKLAQLPLAEDERRAWSFGIAHHVITNHARGQSRRVRLSDRMTAQARTTSAATETSEVLEALSALNGQDRDLLRLIFWDGFGIAEAGALLGMKPATARTRFARAKAKLKAELDRVWP
jgi:RNA polymerase sigma-70 factor (ECF subfamily)